ncbi:MAG: hypothetical protein IE916_08505 [Epsilonproteobacteria bacterium]|nr:hypothetical protein [Campylobacterota bacterium]
MTQNELNSIIDSIDERHLEDIHNKDHSSYFFKGRSYSLLITRFFALSDGGLIGVSTPYIITSESTLLYERTSNSFLSLDDHHISLQESIEEQLERSEDLMLRYIEQIDRIEDELYMRNISPIFLDVWFDLKKDLSRMERMLERAYEALKRYADHFAQDENFPHNTLVHITEHIERYQRLAALNSIKLDTLYNYYNSLKSDKMNKNIYALTILSGIFLPLNLIVGFFGMNTENLFFHDNPHGTVNVVMILMALFFLFIAIVPLISLIERVILRRLLGRFNLYNNLIEGIKKITLFGDK